MGCLIRLRKQTTFYFSQHALCAGVVLDGRLLKEREDSGYEYTTCVAVPIFPYINANREFKEDQLSFCIKKLRPILMYRRLSLGT